MHRVNFILDDKAWTALQEIPKGQRSKVIGSAIEKMATRSLRIKAAKRMDAIAKTLPETSTKQIVQRLREDRSRA
jgi:hypothetical protein